MTGYLLHFNEWVGAKFGAKRGGGVNQRERERERVSLFKNARLLKRIS